MKKCGAIFQSIRNAKDKNLLNEPFSAKDFKKACPGFADNTYKNFLPKHAKGNPSKTTEIFHRIARGKYALL